MLDFKVKSSVHDYKVKFVKNTTRVLKNEIRDGDVFFIDNKISIPEKEQIWVLCSDNEIAWIVGLRLDYRFKITEKTKKAYIVQLFKNKNVRNKI